MNQAHEKNNISGFCLNLEKRMTFFDYSRMRDIKTMEIEELVKLLPKSHYPQYTRKLFYADTKETILLNGDILDDDGNIFRFRKGYLHGDGTLPAIELIDGTREMWKCGVLHCCFGFAIYNIYDPQKGFYYLNGCIKDKI